MPHMISRDTVIGIFRQECRKFALRDRQRPITERRIDDLPLPADFEIGGRAVILLASQLVDIERFGKTYRTDAVDAAENKPGGRTLPKCRTDQDGRSIILVEPFEARGEIHRRTKRGIVHAIDRSDIADDSLSGMEAASRPVDGPSFALELDIQPIVGPLKRERGGA